MKTLKLILQKIKAVFLTYYSKILVVAFLILITTSSAMTVAEGVTRIKDNGNVSSCNTALINISGSMVDYPSASSDTYVDETVGDTVVNELEKAENDSNVSAVLIKINSNGGSTVAGQSIASQLKRMSKPTIVVIERNGDSAAYWASTGASHIIASSLSDVGDIGIIEEVYDQVKNDKQNGYNYIVLTSDKYKATGDVHKPLTQNDQKILMKSIMDSHNIFVQEVATNRNMKIEDVKKLADGTSMSGQDALNAGLIDEIGDMFTAKKYVADTLGLNIGQVKICE